MTVMVASTYDNTRMNDCTAYQSNDAPALDDLIAEINAAFESHSHCKLERPMTGSTECSSGLDKSRPTTTGTAHSEVLKIDWNFPGTFQQEPSSDKWSTEALSLPGSFDSSSPAVVEMTRTSTPKVRRISDEIRERKMRDSPSSVDHVSSVAPECGSPSGQVQAKLFFQPQPRHNTGTSAASPRAASASPRAASTRTSVHRALDMMNLQGVWFSHGRKVVEVTVKRGSIDGSNLVSFPSGASAQLVAKRNQFWLTSPEGKFYLSADVKEDEEGDVNLHWTDGSTWSRKPPMKSGSSTSSATKLQSKSDPSGNRTPALFQKFQKSLSSVCSRKSKKVNASKPKAAMEDVQGKWTVKSKNSNGSNVIAVGNSNQVDIVVDGNSVSWSTGATASLKVHNEQQFWLTSKSGKLYLTGELSAQGNLCWTDGSVWKRTAEVAKEAKSSAAWTEFPEKKTERTVVAQAQASVVQCTGKSQS